MGGRRRALSDDHRPRGEVAEPLTSSRDHDRHRPDGVQGREDVDEPKEVPHDRLDPPHGPAVHPDDPDALRALAGGSPAPHALEHDEVAEEQEEDRGQDGGRRGDALDAGLPQDERDQQERGDLDRPVDEHGDHPGPEPGEVELHLDGLGRHEALGAAVLLHASYTAPVDVDSFIAKYRGEWGRLDAACASGSRGLSSRSGPEIQEIVRLYLRASAHLAEARSSLSDPGLEGYLNQLVARASAAIYSARPRTSRGFARLLTVRYRDAMRRTAPYVLVAAGILVAIAVASWIWVATSSTAQAGLLPPGARDAIHRAGGRRSDLGPPPGVSTYILLNNVKVAFLAFALGITLCVGTVFVLVQNALLLGVLAGAFQAVGNAGSFWALVLPHGILELTAICIAAGAGLRMGWAIIDPGDRLRSVALREETAEAVIVVVGVIPAFVIAALVEGFVTGTSVPDALEIGLGVALGAGYLAFLIGPPRRRTRPAIAGPRS